MTQGFKGWVSEYGRMATSVGLDILLTFSKGQDKRFWRLCRLWDLGRVLCCERGVSAHGEGHTDILPNFLRALSGL